MSSKQSLRLNALAVPIGIELLLHYFSLMLNTYMVTRYSNYLAGSLGAGNQIFDLFITIFSFLSVGCSIVLAQALGARNAELSRTVIAQSALWTMILACICAFGIVCFSDSLLTLLRTPTSQHYQANIYLQLLGVCLIIEALNLLLSAIVRVYNLAYFVMFSAIGMNGVTLLGNYLTLSYTDLALFGVGLATIAGRITLLILLGIALLFWIRYKPSVQDFLVLHKQVLRSILRIGGFSAGENLLWIVQYTIALSFVFSLGAAQASVQTIYFQISLFIMLAGQAISIGNEIIIGKLVGARRFDIAYKHSFKALRISLVASFIVVISVFMARFMIMDILELVEELRLVMLPLFSISLVLELGRTFNIVMVNALRASGDARFPFLSGLVFMFGVSLPLGYVLCFYAGFGIVGIWIGFCADECLRGMINAWRWYSKRWQKLW